MSKTATAAPGATQTMRMNQSKQNIAYEDSVRGHIRRVEDWIEQSSVEMRDYKKEIEMLR